MLRALKTQLSRRKFAVKPALFAAFTVLLSDFGSRGLYAETLSAHHTASGRSARIPRWLDSRQRWRLHPPPMLLRWLLAEGSLTRHLLRASDGDFRVERIAQSWRRPTLSEARLLGVDPQRYALIREVILWGRGEPWVCARSVIPFASLQGELRRLRRLRNSSLGALLFRYPQLMRTPFEMARVAPDLLPTALRKSNASEPYVVPPQTLWARRSRFSIRDQHLIVGEIFLDTFTRSTSALRHP